MAALLELLCCCAELNTHMLLWCAGKTLVVDFPEGSNITGEFHCPDLT
jgi:hypothetical protein